MRIHRKTLWLTLSVLGLLVVLGSAAYLFGVFPGGEDHLRAAQEALQRRDFSAASLHLQKSLDARPNQPAIRLLAAQTYRRQGAFDRAWKLLDQCDKNEAVDLERTLIAVQGGDRAEADRLLPTCLQNPRSPETPLILEAFLQGFVAELPEVSASSVIEEGSEAARWLLLGRRAAELWLESCSTPADRVQGLIWRGRIHALAEEHAAAIADFRQALAIDPDHFDARLYLAQALAYESPQEGALHLQALTRRDPANATVRRALGAVQRGLGRLKESQQTLDALLTDNPNDASALFERGLLALDLNEVADAEMRLRHALALAPNVPSVHFVLSRCLQAAGKTAEAQQHLERYLSLEAERKAKKQR